MKTLIVSATPFEVAPLRDAMLGRQEIEFLVTGVGATATTFELTRRLMQGALPDCIINLGIAGAYDLEVFPIGSVVNVISDQFGDLGATEQDGTWLDLADIGLANKDSLVFSQVNKGLNLFQDLPTAQGLTLQRTSGQAEQIAHLRRTFPQAQLESMEGAAVFHLAQHFDLPFFQIRAVSNLVEPRDRSKWNFPLAIANLNNCVREVLDTIN